jgi:hypothetical protein
MKRKKQNPRRNANRKPKTGTDRIKKLIRSRTSPRVTSAISKMRIGVSLRKASRESGVAPRTVLKWAGSALRKSKSGRYSAKASDRLVRQLKIPTPQGPQEISVRGLRAASRLGRYWVAVHKYYETGDVSGLRKFRGESITAIDRVKYPLLTDVNVLNRLGSAGVLSFESLYAGGV